VARLVIGVLTTTTIAVAPGISWATAGLDGVIVGHHPAQGAARAQAEPPPGNDEPAVNSWALAPGGTTPGQPGNPGSRPNLSYELAPGATTDDSVALFNYGNVQLTFAVYATDAFNNTSGAFDLLPGGQAPTDAGSWIKLPQDHVTAPAHTRIDIPFTLAVPPGALPGDHTAAILAASQVDGRDSQGKVVALDRRTGSRVYLRVAGPLIPRLAIDKVHSTYHWAINPLGGSLDATYTVLNVGNVRLPAHQRLAIMGPFGWRLDERHPADLPELLPGNKITVRAHFTGVPAVVRVSTEVSITPFTTGALPGSPTPPPVARRGLTWAIPWILIAVLLAILAVWWYRRRRRARARRGELDPEPGATGDLVTVD